MSAPADRDSTARPTPAGLDLLRRMERKGDIGYAPGPATGMTAKGLVNRGLAEWRPRNPQEGLSWWLALHLTDAGRAVLAEHATTNGSPTGASDG